MKGGEAKRPARLGRNAKSKAQKSITEMFRKGGNKGDAAEDDTTTPSQDISMATTTIAVVDSVQIVDVSDASSPPREAVVCENQRTQTDTALKEVKAKRIHPLFEKRKPNPEPMVLQEPELPSSPILIIDVVNDIPSEPAQANLTSVPTATQAPTVISIPSSNGATRDAPILIDSPTNQSIQPPPMTFVQPTPSSSAAGKVFPIRYTPQPFRSVQGMNPLLPGKGESLLNGPQTSFPLSASPFPRKSERNLATLRSLLDDSDRASSSLLPSFPPIETEDDTSPEHIPAIYLSYPAISRFHQRPLPPEIEDQAQADSLAQEQWTEKWRPRRAEEVIGNENHALYLRDWLTALRLQVHAPQEPEKGNRAVNRRVKKRKRPEIIREVKKRKAISDFIVSDDSENEGSIRTYFPPYVEMQANPSTLASSAHSRTTSLASSPLSSPPATDFEDDDYMEPLPQALTPFGSKLHSTILLCGPSGSGKTAAVYACAQELGWDVFEVYPGIGDRTGSALNKLIGDVGKNHLVKAVHHGRDFFGSRKAMSRQAATVNGDNTSLDPTQLGSPQSAHADASGQVKQSLVLVEEVDILYQTDTGFWSALVNIIKECRRPVVLTCNDISIVPTDILPLQTTLYFQPCASPLATSYLRALCLAESVSVGQKTLQSLYEGTWTTLEPISENVGQFSRPPHRFDLRHCINQLQFWASRLTKIERKSLTPNPTPQSMPAIEEICGQQQQQLTDPCVSERLLVDSAEPLQQLRMLARAQDTASFIDAELSRNVSHPFHGVLMADRGEFSPSDEEIGYRVLRTEPTASCQDFPFTPFFHRDQDLANEALKLLRLRGLDQCGSISSDMEERQLSERQASYGLQMAPAFAWTRRVFTSGNHVPQYLDYLPWIRYIVGVENAAQTQQTLAPNMSQSKRTSENSRKTRENRFINLSKDDLETLRETALGFPEEI